MRLIFASSYHYPAYPAQFKHGLLMAKGYAKLLGDNFMYFVMYDRQGALNGMHFKEMNPHVYKIRKMKLLSLYLFIQYTWFFARHAAWRGRDVVVITQESKIALLLLILKVPFRFRVMYECHGLHSPLTDHAVCRLSDFVIFVTQKSEEEARARYGVRESKVVPNAVDLTLFEHARQRGKKDLRQSLNLPRDNILVGYVGRFFALGYDKGIEAGLRACAHIASSDVMFCFVGGTENEIRIFSERAEMFGVGNRAIFVPYQNDPRRLAEYTVAMDVLMYAPPSVKFFMEETSPMKLYEYMAAEKPIVVSDFPAIREILSDDSAYFVKGESGEKLAQTIRQAIEEKQEAATRAANAYKLVQNATWDHRSETVIRLAKNLV